MLGLCTIFQQERSAAQLNFYVEPTGKIMKLNRVISVAYCAAMLVIFIVEHYLLKLDEMGLYIFMSLLNLPASAVLIPLIDSSKYLQTLPHEIFLWFVQLSCTIGNGTLLFLAIAGLRKIYASRSKKSLSV